MPRFTFRTLAERVRYLRSLEMCPLCWKKMDPRAQTLRYHTAYGETVHEACYQEALEQEWGRA